MSDEASPSQSQSEATGWRKSGKRKLSNSHYPDANIHNFAPVARIMKSALPENAKIAKEAKECMQECVSEFISFITSEGKHWPILPCCSEPDLAKASEKCQQEKRKTVNGEDILFAMTSLGFENYAEALKIYLARYREVSCRSSFVLKALFPSLSHALMICTNP
jgi:nuclear transcription Y subunit beta